MVSKIAHSLEVVGLAVLLLACDGEPEPEPSEPEPAVAQVTVAAAQEEGGRHRVRSLGEIRPSAEHTIAVGSPGRVRSVHADVGDRVAAGDVLVRLDPRRDGLTLERARANGRRASVDLRRADKDLARLRALRADGVVSQEAVEQAESRVDLARVAVADAKAAGRLARHDLSQGTVRAPVAGTVTARAVEPGQQVQPTEVLMVVDAEALDVATWVSERDVRGIRVGDPADVRLWGHAAGWSAEVTEVARRADRRTGNFQILLRLDDAPRARVGLTAEVELAVRDDGATVTIPEDAVVTRDRRLAVFVVDDKVARRVHPRLGPPVDGRVPVFEGIEAGEAVVIEGAARVEDGGAVETAP